ncbi:F0F1 ATP synthase subunit delta [Novosphingopyxis sp.]|uniref:F0F1 ATP synthase subunit delta n=1 Tax=Novosphingopyxis sp. TaxID=2709690 RepID=UPI003B5AB5A0
METSSGISASLAGRYATALFELARDRSEIAAVERSLDTLKQALDEVPAFKAVTTSPELSRDQAERTVLAVADQLGVDTLTRNFLGVLSENRRLGQLGHVARDFNILTAAHRGEVTAEVVSAHALSDDQMDALRKQLRARVGRDVNVQSQVDPSILGGLVVKIGSRMIDNSIRTRLNTLATAMKG